jgi:hypothetical protein
MSLDYWIKNLPQRSDIYPQRINLILDQVLLTELPKAERKAASFLDNRALKPDTRRQWLPWEIIASIMDTEPHTRHPHYIFHTSHCGSSMLSRLLEYADDTECLREPVPLRTLAIDMADSRGGRAFLTRKQQLHRLEVLSKMWSRSSKHTIIKATSVCTDLRPYVLSSTNEAKAIFIYNRAKRHIETLLSSKNPIPELKGFAQLRIQRLRQATGLDLRLEDLGLGQLAALSWLSETTSIATEPELSNKTALVEFDSFLQQPKKNLIRLFNHLELPNSEETAVTASESAVMKTYSKAPDTAYNANTRAEILSKTREQFKTEIHSGISWIEKNAKKSKLIATAYDRFN